MAEAEFPAVEVAVLVPCHNEEATVGKVVRDFRAQLPHARIYVYDNASSDRTAQEAAESGAIVRHEPLRGKGNVVRRMFADVESDVYVLVDGDATYAAEAVGEMIERLQRDRLDMVTGVRRHSSTAAYRPGHQFGNRLLTSIVRMLFADRFADMLSGYRVMSRRLVKSFPSLSSGFEIETELTIHALELRAGLADVETEYRERPKGSDSKLRTVHDGLRIISLIAKLVTIERPLMVFGGLALLLLLLDVLLGLPVLLDYLETGRVPRFPTAILSMILLVVSILTAMFGVALQLVTHTRREMKRLAYLREPWLSAERPDRSGGERG